MGILSNHIAIEILEGTKSGSLNPLFFIFSIANKENDYIQFFNGFLPTRLKNDSFLPTRLKSDGFLPIRLKFHNGESGSKQAVFGFLPIRLK